MLVLRTDGDLVGMASWTRGIVCGILSCVSPNSLSCVYFVFSFGLDYYYTYSYYTYIRTLFENQQHFGPNLFSFNT